MHDLLSEALIGVRTSEGEQHLNLPELLAALSAGHIEGYTGLRAHQADPWHVFIVQLAASIQARRPTDRLPEGEDYWRAGLLDLAEGIPEAWHLVVEDVTKPAFFQHPWQSWQAEAADYGITQKRSNTSIDPKARTPDELDVLVTSKNHDVKIARIDAQTLEGWLYALLVLQTTSGFLGQGNYGILRMNGGFASRPIVSWTRSLNPSVRFQDELLALKRLRSGVISQFKYAQRGVVLTWLQRWNRDTHQFNVKELEPWFVETARPLRLIRDDTGAILALGATSKARQIGPKSIDNGDVGDPWTPINIQDKKKGRSALTLSAKGFTPQRLVDLLFEQGLERTALQIPRPGSEGWLVASCLVRGQGKTEGFHRIELPIPSKASMMLLNRQQPDNLATLAPKLLIDAEEVEEALNYTLTALTKGGPDQIDPKRDESWVKAVRQDFAKRWEVIYFPTLWRGADEPHQSVREGWQRALATMGQDLLDTATERLPLPANRYWRAITRAQSVWIGKLRKAGLQLPQQRTTHITAMEETMS